MDDQNKQFQVTTHLSGKHNLQNISTAIAVGKYFKVPSEKIVHFLKSYQPQNNRSQWLEKNDVHFLLDAYNANPTSMRASLESFSGQGSEQKVAILGDMLELGETRLEHHLTIAKYAQDLGLEKIFLVGKLFEKAANQLGLQHFMTIEELKISFDYVNWKGSKVLIKGSRGMALERLLEDK